MRSITITVPGPGTLTDESQEFLAQVMREHGWQVRAPRDQFVTPLQHAGHDTDHAVIAKMQLGTFREEMLWLFINAEPNGIWGLEKQGWTDSELVEKTGRSESTVRSARNTLLNRGLVYDSGERRPTPAGNPAIVWRRTRRQAAFLKK